MTKKRKGIVFPGPDAPSTDDGPERKRARITASPMALDGILHLDEIQSGRGRYMLTNTLSGERVSLDGWRWHLEFGFENTDAVLLKFDLTDEDGDPEPKGAIGIYDKGMLTKQILISEAGAKYIRDVNSTSSTPEAMADAYSKNADAVLELQVGEAAAMVKLEAHVFQMARGSGQKLFWEAPQILRHVEYGLLQGEAQQMARQKP